MIAFGPIPSRRLGRSLGINNIPPKHCSYACVYCQVGATDRLRIKRGHFIPPEQIRAEVEAKLRAVQTVGDRVDTMTFVPDGEPTLDADLGRTIDLLKPLGIKIAVLTNSSLLTDPSLRKDLMKADYVSVKLDAASEKVWRTINRPHRRLRFTAMLDAIELFAGMFQGTFVTETMLVRGINDDERNITGVKRLLAHLKPSTAYLSIPTRPPAEHWVRPPSPEVLERAYQSWAEVHTSVELLTEYEGNDIGLSGEIEEAILSIASVHPIREDALREILGRTQTDWSVIRELILRGKLLQREYGNKNFFVRNLKH